MGLIAFVKEAGAFLFGHAARNPQPASAASQLTVDVLRQQVAALGIPVDNLSVDLHDSVASIKGVVATQGDREKVVLGVGNTPGVAQVDDQLTVKASEPAATFYTVKSGDTLSAIARSQYGDANKYPRIFEANKPMLQDPNKIYPGQVLRIPPKV